MSACTKHTVVSLVLHAKRDTMNVMYGEHCLVGNIKLGHTGATECLIPYLSPW